MKIVIAASLLLLAADAQPEIAPKYFQHVREIKVEADASKQPYVAIDEPVWNGSENALGDLRVYDSGREVPYTLVRQGAKDQSTDTPAHILNQGATAGHTSFVIETPIDEFDTLTLDLKTKDFTTRARVAGGDELPGTKWTDLGEYTLFDFTKEQLGRNWTIRLKSPVKYKYVRIEIADSVKPDEVLEAAIANRQREKAKFTDWSVKPQVAQERGKTVFTWPGSEKVPLEHIQLEVDKSELNFSRAATLYCEGEKEEFAKQPHFDVQTHADISRVKLERKQRKIEHESLEVEPGALHCKNYKLEIANGDDAPLKITAFKPQSIERRVYWKNDARAPKLYYGDKKTGMPQYDFAKFFDESANVVRAELGPEIANAEYAARPDERPWSERYPQVLWTALIVAVFGLGAWALKGFKS
jgi:Protein of unknown function (DUF3999)